MPRLSDTERETAPKTGLLILQLITLGLFFVLVGRLWYLQIKRGEELAVKAEENQLRRQLVFAPRGRLMDSNGALLALNQPAYALAVIREDVRDVDAALAQASNWTGVDREALRKRWEQGKKRVKPFDRWILVPDLSFDQVTKIEANAAFWPGMEIMVIARRVYPQSRVLSHILGYVAEASEADLEKDEDLGLGDLVGKQGIELTLEKRLRGTKGLTQLEVDATGRILGSHALRPSYTGENLALSIDLGLQEHAAKLMDGQAGAVVVMEPYTGRLLALVTAPGYDNNVFTGVLKEAQWRSLRDHPRSPLQNRAIQSVYPPGSVWKLVTAACGLSEGVTNTAKGTFCPGDYKLGNLVFRCWKKEGHGTVAMRDALVHSCDVYFYQLGERIGVDRLARYAEACGFGRPTGIDLPNEKGGLVPNKEWKRRRFKEGWAGGETLNMSIGQGYTLVNPLQTARFVSALVNGGKLLKPQLVGDAKAEVQSELPLSAEYRRLLLESMVETVQRGTATKVKRDDARIGGKTGTAQVVKIAELRKKVEDMPYKFRDHAWLATFGEKAGKSYVVICMVEHGGHGGTAAGPIVKGVYDYLFGPSKGGERSDHRPRTTGD